MKKIFLLLTISTLSLYALSDSAMQGKDLYMEADCQKCHGIDIEYDGKKNKVKNRHDLGNWVKSCASHFNIGWFPEEEKAVIKYLDEIYYNLEQK